MMRRIESQLAFDEERLRVLVVEEFPVGCSVRIKAGPGQTLGRVVARGIPPRPVRHVCCENTCSRNARPSWYDYRNLERVD